MWPSLKLSAATGPHVELLSIALSPLHAFARRHSWSPLVVVGEEPADRPAAWAKVPLIREVLQEADVVCWVDSDAIVVDLSTDILDELVPGKDLYLVRHFGADPPHETPNTGAMMWRAGEWADRMLERVWSSEHLVDHPWWENAALLEILGYELEPVARLRERREEMDRVKLIDPAWNSVPYGNPPARRRGSTTGGARSPSRSGGTGCSSRSRRSCGRPARRLKATRLASPAIRNLSPAGSRAVSRARRRLRSQAVGVPLA